MTKKILCTLGPASLNPRTIRRLDELHVDLFRLNLSHTNVEKIEELVGLIRTYSDIPICLDTQGAQVRTSAFAGGRVTLELNSMIEFAAPLELGDATRIPLYPASILTQLAVGDLVSIDFGTALLQVTEAGTSCGARVVSSGTIGSNKAVSIDRVIDLPPLTDVDYAAIERGLHLGIFHFALSFANHRSDVELFRDIVGKQVQIIAKIESQLGLSHLVEILDAADVILIDRGDLSREVSIESIPFVQKEIIRRANEASVPVYVATNLLESMVVSPKPTRAEVNDVVNTLLDGADGLVLATETAIGDHPVGCTSMIRSLIRQYETRIESSDAIGHLSSTSQLIAPHGGRLIERILTEYDHSALQELPRLDIDDRLVMDVQQIAMGTFSPLEGFMGREVLAGVLDRNQLPDGTVWTMPILLQLAPESAITFARGETVALVNRERIRALLTVEECFPYNLAELAANWFGTTNCDHPGVAQLFCGSNHFIAGKVDLLSDDLRSRRPIEMTPAQTRIIFEHRQWQKVIGFHTRNVAHRAHEHLQLTALEDNHCDGIFIHPVIGPKKVGDFASHIILKSYQHLIEKHYPSSKTLLGGFISYSRYAGPREALFTALCRKNFGCSHFIVGRDHTGVSDFYAPEASKRLFDTVGEIGIQPVFFDEVYYCQECRTHVEKCQHGHEFSEHISGTQAREMLRSGTMLPEWYMRETVSRLILEELKNENEVFVS